MNKRNFLLVTGLSLACSFSFAQQAFPNKPIKIIVPYSAGGPADLLARTLGDKMGQKLSQPIIIENKPGAGGHTGGEQVARSAADGYTLMLGTISHNGASKLYKGLRYDPTKDITPVSLIAEAPSVLIVNSNSSIKSVAELIDFAKKNPNKLTYGSAGDGSAMHMAAELFKDMAKVELVHVPYRGGAPAMADLLGGQIDLIFESLGTAHPHLKGGKVKALAVTSPERTASLPDIPTVSESGVPGYASVPWYTISAPKGTPNEIVNKLNAEINEALKSDDLRVRWNGLGILPIGGSIQDANARNEIETKKWNKIIESLGIQVK
ncbi:MAG: tripartite tricarboxylate transporter substrate binding protein [Comamonas sp.]|nr:tripartite tricarboxylate transporter substrate binding protein [Comamonas sp.]